jgi:glucose/arabinose dehydrogenase
MLVLLAASLLAPVTGTGPGHAAAGEQAVATGLDNPVAFTVNPSDTNELWYGERFTGEIRRRNIVTSADSLVYTVPGVLTDGEQGLLGLALDPGFPVEPYVYAYATRSKNGGNVNMVLRITVANGVGVQRKTVLKVPNPTPWHNGGRIRFGPDGMLWVATGEGTQPTAAQDLDSPRGKVLRIMPDGTIPPDNPIAGNPMWAFGIRNAFGFTFDPAIGSLWLTDNGPDCNDEVNRIKRRRNYAWGENADCQLIQAPHNTNQDGPAPRKLPEHFYATPLGITGAAICDGCGLDSGQKLYVGNVNNGDIFRLTFDSTRKTIVSSALYWHHAGPVIGIETAPGQPIYFSDTTAIYKLVTS